MMRADLHVHSTASDGQYTPSHLKQMGRELSLDYLALTDHDTLCGLSEWPADDLGPRLIPGVEISCAGDREIHLLAYGASPEHPELKSLLQSMREERRSRALRMVEALRRLGFSIEIGALPEAASIGRPHLARLLAATGQVADIQEAFDKYLAAGRPAYIPRTQRSPGDMIRCLRSWGLVPVLAHPGQYGYSPQTLRGLLAFWQRQGLAGIEVYHSANRPAQPFETLARELDLLVTGGSDFHDTQGGHSPLGSQADAWRSAQQDMERLLRLLEK